MCPWVSQCCLDPGIFTALRPTFISETGRNVRTLPAQALLSQGTCCHMGSTACAACSSLARSDAVMNAGISAMKHLGLGGSGSMLRVRGTLLDSLTVGRESYVCMVVCPGWGLPSALSLLLWTGHGGSEPFRHG